MYQLGTNFHFLMRCNPSIHYRGRTFLNSFSCLLAFLLLMKCNFNPFSIIFNQRLVVESHKPVPTMHSIFLISCGRCPVISQYAVYWELWVTPSPNPESQDFFLYLSNLFQPVVTFMGGFQGPGMLSSKPQHFLDLLCTRFQLAQQFI